MIPLASDALSFAITYSPHLSLLSDYVSPMAQKKCQWTGSRNSCRLTAPTWLIRFRDDSDAFTCSRAVTLAHSDCGVRHDK